MKIHSLLFQIIAPTVVGIIIGGVTYGLLTHDKTEPKHSGTVPAHFASEVLPAEESPTPEPSATDEPVPDLSDLPPVVEHIQKRVDTLETKEDTRSEAEKAAQAEADAEAKAAAERAAAYEQRGQDAQDAKIQEQQNAEAAEERLRAERAAKAAAEEEERQKAEDLRNSEACQMWRDDC